MGKKTVLRFSFELDGDHRTQGLRLPGWRVLANKNDVYITTKSLGGTLKVSIHDEIRYQHERPWLLAYTKEHMRSDRPLWPTDRDRTVHRFRPTDFENGIRRVFAIGVTRGCLRPNRRVDNEAVVGVPDRWDALTVVNILMTETNELPSGWDLPTTPSLPLDNGRHVWIASNTEQVDEIDPEPVPDGNILQVRDPDEHDVACPGLMVRPIRFD